MNLSGKIWFLLPVLMFVMSITTSCNKITAPESPDENEGICVAKLQVPEGNKIYHAAFPDFGGTEDVVTENRIIVFEKLAGKEIAWAYFSNNWFPETGGIVFPGKAVQIIHNTGRVPFIRMMPRSDFNEGGPDPVFTMQKIIDGDFDSDLKNWAREAKQVPYPLLVEFGTEVNGNWFPWNGEYNGKDSKTNYGSPALFDGMERFRDAYRHIITICNNAGANNITWFYHVDIYSSPESGWNNMSGYYPGDNYIDWIGVSVYGPQDKQEGWWSFEDVLDDSWDELLSISKTGKPIALLEWGVIDYPSVGNKATWIKSALANIKPGGKYYPLIKAVSYWNEDFNQTNLRIDSSPESLRAYSDAISDSVFVSKVLFDTKAIKE